jgi:hypothetical protein
MLRKRASLTRDSSGIPELRTLRKVPKSPPKCYDKWIQIHPVNCDLRNKNTVPKSSLKLLDKWIQKHIVNHSSRKKNNDPEPSPKVFSKSIKKPEYFGSVIKIHQFVFFGICFKDEVPAECPSVCCVNVKKFIISSIRF